MIDLQSPARPDMREVIVESPVHVLNHIQAPLIQVRYHLVSRKDIGEEVDVHDVRHAMLGRRASQDGKTMKKTHLRGSRRSEQNYHILNTPRKRPQKHRYPDPRFRVRRVSCVMREEANGITLVVGRQRQCAGRRRC